ncbi:MAG: glycosyltransferase family 4 protein [Spirochaetales bacterium]|nr:glycosyltransferase family 4 protein [Spirochaetales bacterium]
MKILMVNKFFWPKGGSERVFFEEAEFLKAKGHTLSFFSMHDKRNLPCDQNGYFIRHVNYEKFAGIKQELLKAAKLIYSVEAKHNIKRLLDDFKPDLVHLHNIHHQISPSILDALREYNIPAAITLHDYKLVCPTYAMLWRGKPCEKCKNGRFFWCALKKCNKNSYLKSLLNVVEMYIHHKLLHIYDKIDVFICPSMFLKEKIREMGFKRKLCHLPNFIKPEKYMPAYDFKERSLVYFGRLSREKGLAGLIRAVKDLDITLKIIGDGPLRQELESEVKQNKLTNIIFTGYKEGQALEQEIRKSMFVVLPSQWYENNPRTVIEAFALGKPVVGSRIGGIPELVKHGERGLTFIPGNVEDQKAKINYLLNNPKQVGEMGKKARKFVERELNPEKHYKNLMEIYQTAMENHT